MLGRELLWYRYSISDPERHFYNFLIVNEPREVAQIKQKIYEQLRPIVEETKIGDGSVNGLSFELFNLETPTSSIRFPKRIYRGKFRWDRRLQPRRTDNGWSKLLDSVSSGVFS